MGAKAMSDLILMSLGLMLAAFAFGAMPRLGGRRSRRQPPQRPSNARRVSRLLDAAETFTTGVVVPFKAEGAAVPAPTPRPCARLYAGTPAPARFEMAAANVAIIRHDDTSLQTRVSSLVGHDAGKASRRPVQQAGSVVWPRHGSIRAQGGRRTI